MTETTVIKIKIFNKEYKIKCPIDKQDELIRTADFINKKIKNIHSNQRLDSFDHLTMISTLNFTNELINQNKQKDNEIKKSHHKIRELEKNIDELIRAKSSPLRKPNISLEELL
tara:strand:- start:2923 stop:3264 length:342 start_codon:yes stop_codon:yes gene_type:complete